MVAAAAHFTSPDAARYMSPPVGLQSMRSLVPYILARYGVPLEEETACSGDNSQPTPPVRPLRQQRFDFAR